MPSMTTNPIQLALKTLGIAAITLCLINCGGGSSSGTSATGNSSTSGQTTLKDNEIEVLLPFEMRNVNLKLVDFLTNQTVSEVLNFSGNSKVLQFPIQKPNQLYRLEISTNANSQIYNPLTDQYNDPSTEPFLGTYKAFIFPTFTDRRSFIITPVSNMIYERTLVRAGQLPGETIDPSKVKDYHLNFATDDVNAALMNIFKSTSTPLLTKGTLALGAKSYASNNQLYIDTFKSFGLFNYWYKQQSSLQTYQKLTQNLTTDLLDGYLDGKTILGGDNNFVKLVTTVPNTDPTMNNGPALAETQKTARVGFANLLKNATLDLALDQRQDIIDPKGYDALGKSSYLGSIPTATESGVRTAGAGDYRLAVGFTGSTDKCFESTVPCKQGLTGINIATNKSFPSIDYLIGRQTNTSGCVLKIRPEGEVELSNASQSFSGNLNAEGIDNLLQVNAANNLYTLNVGSESNVAGQYDFIQLTIRNNVVTNAVAGRDTRKAPDDLTVKLLQCSFAP